MEDYIKTITNLTKLENTTFNYDPRMTFDLNHLCDVNIYFPNFQ